MATLPHPAPSDKPVFIPPQKRRAASGKCNTFTPSRSTGNKSVIYGDQILNVQVGNKGANINKQKAA